MNEHLPAAQRYSWDFYDDKGPVPARICSDGKFVHFFPLHKPKPLKDILLPCFTDNDNWLR